ncbi:hypothetical protein [Rhizobium sp. BK251]|nr:hypothetical protein [Rhizobium sp. BK251]
MALITALGWAVDQPSFTPRADHIVNLITSTVLTRPPGNATMGAGT